MKVYEQIRQAFRFLVMGVIVFSFALLALSFSTAQPAQAQSFECRCANGQKPAIYPSRSACEATDTSGCLEKCKSVGSLNSLCVSVGQKVSDDGDRECGKDKLCDPLGERKIPEIIGGAIKVFLGIIGSIALALFVFGGFTWMTAGGSPDKVKKGRDILVWAALGLIVIFASFAILNFVFGVAKGVSG